MRALGCYPRVAVFLENDMSYHPKPLRYRPDCEYMVPQVPVEELTETDDNPKPQDAPEKRRQTHRPRPVEYLQ